MDSFGTRTANVGRLSDIRAGKCPRCRSGNIFEFPVSKLSSFNRMNEFCPNCGLRFEVEPGFFIGAMYVSYAVVVAIMTVVGFPLYFLVDPPLWVYGLTVGVIVVLLLPWIFRFSRILFLYWFGGIKANPGTKSKNR